MKCDNTIINIKQQPPKSHIFGGGGSATSSPLILLDITLSHNIYYVDIRVWYKWRLVSRGMTMFNKIIPFWLII